MNPISKGDFMRYEIYKPGTNKQTDRYLVILLSLHSGLMETLRSNLSNLLQESIQSELDSNT